MPGIRLAGCISMYVLSLCAPDAAAAVTCIPISSLPAVITSPGQYCLTKNLSAKHVQEHEVAAIWIQADNVDIDFRGHAIDGSEAVVLIGVTAEDHSHISIHNGTIRGFLYGVLLFDNSPGYSATSGHLISHVTFGHIQSVAIQIAGTGTEIRNNLFRWSGEGPNSGSPRILSVAGPGSRIHHNTITDTLVTAEDSGPNAIEVTYSPGCIVEDNKVIRTTAKGLTVGVILWFSPDCAVRNNTIKNPKKRPLDVGIWLVQSDGVDTSSNDFIHVTTEVMTSP